MSHIGPTVRRTRFFVLAAVRLAALVIIIIGLYGLTQTLAQMISFGVFNALTIYYGAGFSWLGFAMGFLVPGCTLAVFSTRLAVWVTPMPRRECLDCGYQLRNMQATVCPECATPID